uniref:Uncharacterized protein n=1 Tax=Rhizophora mucronata TaxID=61149 RepID=A0A2P2QQH6_RHIMU
MSTGKPSFKTHLINKSNLNKNKFSSFRLINNSLKRKFIVIKKTRLVCH